MIRLKGEIVLAENKPPEFHGDLDFQAFISQYGSTKWDDGYMAGKKQAFDAIVQSIRNAIGI